MFLPCWQGPSQKDLKGRCNSPPPKKLQLTCRLWVDLSFLYWNQWIKSASRAQKEKRFKDQTLVHWEQYSKPFTPHLGLFAAGLETTLCILTLHETPVLAKPTVEPPTQLTLPFAHSATDNVNILPLQCYISLLYLCYLLPILKLPRKINRAPFFSTVISAHFIKVIRT